MLSYCVLKCSKLQTFMRKKFNKSLDFVKTYILIFLEKLDAILDTVCMLYINCL